MNKPIKPLYNGRATFGPVEPEYQQPEGARPFQEPTPAEVCKAKLAVAQKVHSIREKDREASR